MCRVWSKKYTRHGWPDACVNNFRSLDIFTYTFSPPPLLVKKAQPCRNYVRARTYLPHVYLVDLM